MEFFLSSSNFSMEFSVISFFFLHSTSHSLLYKNSKAANCWCRRAGMNKLRAAGRMQLSKYFCKKKPLQWGRIWPAGRQFDMPADIESWQQRKLNKWGRKVSDKTDSVLQNLTLWPAPMFRGEREGGKTLNKKSSKFFFSSKL
jgi:hypothetical protein